MKRTPTATIAAFGLALSLAAAGATGGTASAYAAAPVRWHTPDCARVQSDGLLTYTPDEGVTVAPTTGITHEIRYTEDITALATPNELLSVDSTGALSLTTDAGCSWTRTNQVTGVPYGRLAASPDGSAYLWGLHSNRLLHVTGARVVKLPPVDVSAPMLDLVVDEHNGAHLRAILKDGRVVDSTDAGQRFELVGRIPFGTSATVKSACIDPVQLNHIVAGTGLAGSYASFNGGRTWTHDGMGKPGDLVAVGVEEISPASPHVVYAVGVNDAEATAGLPSEGRHLYRSADGGRTFRPIIDDHSGPTGEVRVLNDAPVFPSPTDANKVHFVYGTGFLGHGTDLYTLDARSGWLTMAHDPHSRLMSAAFNPADPNVMYLGFAAEHFS